MRWIARWIAAVRRFFRKRRPAAQPPLLLLAAPRKRGRNSSLVLPPVIALPGALRDNIFEDKRYKGLITSFEGRFYFKDDVLDQLDYYFKSIRRFKLSRSDYYDLAAQVGIHLVPDRSIIVPHDKDKDQFPIATKVDPWFAQTLPGFGAYCYGTAKKLRERETKKAVMHPRFIYFTRYARKGVPITVQPVKEGAVYVVGFYYDQTGIEGPRKIRRGRKTGLVEMPVLVKHDGTLVALKTLQSKVVAFPKKNKHRRHHAAARQEWGFDDDFHQSAKDFKTTPENYICQQFVEAAERHSLLNSSMIRVRVTKDGLAGVLNVDMERTPYFFKDRQPVVVDGVKKKIFHIVRPHERLRGNVSADVRMHFRGLRDFQWNGYDVTITVPGWDHNNWAEASLSAYDEESKKGGKIKNPVFMKELGETAVKAMRGRYSRTRGQYEA